MKTQYYAGTNTDQGGLCASCGAPYHQGDHTDQGRLLGALVSGTGGRAMDLCPSCRQRQVARRIGVYLSSRM